MNAPYNIQACEFVDIFNIWRDQLWPKRQSLIEPISWLSIDGTYCEQFALERPSFWMARSPQNEVVGVLGGHPTPPGLYRTRGLWIREDFRRRGLGRRLMQELFNEALRMGYRQVWTMPRISSWPFYESCGFHVLRRADEFEFGPHFIAKIELQ